MNQELYELLRPTGHLMIDAYGKKMLIDTGSPVSVSDEYFEFMGKLVMPATLFHGHPLSKLSEWLGEGVIDVLIGMDVIQQYDWMIDGRENKVVVSRLPMNFRAFNASSIPFFNYFSRRALIVPVEISLPSIHNMPVNLFFDTGSRITYLHSSLFNIISDVWDIDWKDFYPNYGYFYTLLKKVVIHFPKTGYKAKAGLLPTLLESALLDMNNVMGILGLDVLEHYRIHISVWNGVLNLIPLPE